MSVSLSDQSRQLHDCYVSFLPAAVPVVFFFRLAATMEVVPNRQQQEGAYAQ